MKDTAKPDTSTTAKPVAKDIQKSKTSPADQSAAKHFGESATQIQEDPIFELLMQFRQDTRDDKVDLGIGVYRDNLNQSPIFAAVKNAEQWRVDSEEDKAYIGPLGDTEFCRAVAGLAMGDDLAALVRPRLSYAQTPGGVGALRLAFEMFDNNNPDGTLWLSDTTWQVHIPIAEAAGLTLARYSYFDPQKGPLGFDAMLNSLKQAKPGDAVLLQVSCQNPTGLDLTDDQWRTLATFCQKQNLLPIIDMAYHGLGNGLEDDRSGLRIMASEMQELMLCYTCSKNFGLYRDRTGMVMALTRGDKERQTVDKQWAQLATRHYFTPPAHGASLVRKILNDDQLRALWEAELGAICARLNKIRHKLHFSLCQIVPERDWSFLTQGRGMFAIFPFSAEEITRLRVDHGLYIVPNGRVNLSGFNYRNIDKALDAFDKVLNNKPA